jgi:hypothetical protein
LPKFNLEKAPGKFKRMKLLLFNLGSPKSLARDIRVLPIGIDKPIVGLCH